MATRPNWGKGRNLRIMLFDRPDEASLMTAVNDWLIALEEEEIIDMLFQIAAYGTPVVEHLHCHILYTEE